MLWGAWRGIGVGPWAGWVGRPLACSTRGDGKVGFWCDFPPPSVGWRHELDDVPWQFAGTTQCLEEYVRGGYQLSGSPGTSGSAEIPSARLQCPWRRLPGAVRCKPIAGPRDRPPRARRPYQTTQHPPPQLKLTFRRLGRPWRHFYRAIIGPGLKTGRNGRVEGWGRQRHQTRPPGPRQPANILPTDPTHVTSNL